MSEAGLYSNGPASPTGKYIDGIDPDDPEYIKNLQRPAEVKEDLQQMENRSRVSIILNSQAFKEELEQVVEEQLRNGPYPASLIALQQITDLLLPHSKGSLGSLARSSSVIPINDLRGTESLGYVKGEKLLRCKLAALYRIMDLCGWSHGIHNHISARVSTESEHFLLNPFGLTYSEITASSLVKVDIRGDIVDPGSTHLGVNKSGFTVHSAIHQARPDIKCIVHLHTPAAVAISALKCGLLAISQEALICGSVSYHDFQHVALDADEKEKLARNLGVHNKILILRNRGVLACGETVEEAFHFTFNIMAACEAQVKVMPVGLDNIVIPSAEVREQTFRVANQGGGGVDSAGRKWKTGELEFEALMRTLDNSGFRTGYIYKMPVVKQEKKERSNSEVEIPPSSSSFTYVFDGDFEHSKYASPVKAAMERQKKAYKAGWLTTPNAYKKTEVEEIGTITPKKITKWVTDVDSPNRPAGLPIKVDNPNQFAPQGSNPREYKDRQKSIKKDYYEERITAGPQSKILEGLTWDEAQKVKDGQLSATGEQLIVLGAASKGIIQRDHQHNAVVYRQYYAANPFENMTEAEIEEYQAEVQRRERGEPVVLVEEKIPEPVVEVVREAPTPQPPPEPERQDTEARRSRPQEEAREAPDAIKHQPPQGYHSINEEAMLASLADRVVQTVIHDALSVARQGKGQQILLGAEPLHKHHFLNHGSVGSQIFPNRTDYTNLYNETQSHVVNYDNNFSHDKCSDFHHHNSYRSHAMRFIKRYSKFGRCQHQEETVEIETCQCQTGAISTEDFESYCQTCKQLYYSHSEGSKIIKIRNLLAERKRISELNRGMVPGPYQRSKVCCSSSEHEEAGCSTSEHSGASCSSMEYPEAGYSSMEHPEAGCSSMEHPEAGCSSMEHHEADCSNMEYSETTKIPNKAFSVSSYDNGEQSQNQFEQIEKHLKYPVSTFENESASNFNLQQNSSYPNTKEFIRTIVPQNNCHKWSKDDIPFIRAFETRKDSNVQFNGKVLVQQSSQIVGCDTSELSLKTYNWKCGIFDESLLNISMCEGNHTQSAARSPDGLEKTIDDLDRRLRLLKSTYLDFRHQKIRWLLELGLALHAKFKENITNHNLLNSYCSKQEKCTSQQIASDIYNPINNTGTKTFFNPPVIIAYPVTRDNMIPVHGYSGVQRESNTNRDRQRFERNSHSALSTRTAESRKATDPDATGSESPSSRQKWVPKQKKERNLDQASEPVVSAGRDKDGTHRDYEKSEERNYGRQTNRRARHPIEDERDTVRGDNFWKERDEKKRRNEEVRISHGEMRYRGRDLGRNRKKEENRRDEQNEYEYVEQRRNRNYVSSRRGQEYTDNDGDDRYEYYSRKGNYRGERVRRDDREYREKHNRQDLRRERRNESERRYIESGDTIEMDSDDSSGTRKSDRRGHAQSNAGSKSEDRLIKELKDRIEDRKSRMIEKNQDIEKQILFGKLIRETEEQKLILEERENKLNREEQKFNLKEKESKLTHDEAQEQKLIWKAEGQKLNQEMEMQKVSHERERVTTKQIETLASKVDDLSFSQKLSATEPANARGFSEGNVKGAILETDIDGNDDASQAWENEGLGFENRRGDYRKRDETGRNSSHRYRGRSEDRHKHRRRQDYEEDRRNSDDERTMRKKNDTSDKTVDYNENFDTHNDRDTHTNKHEREGNQNIQEENKIHHEKDSNRRRHRRNGEKERNSKTPLYRNEMPIILQRSDATDVPSDSIKVREKKLHTFDKSSDSTHMINEDGAQLSREDRRRRGGGRKKTKQSESEKEEIPERKTQSRSMRNDDLVKPTKEYIDSMKQSTKAGMSSKQLADSAYSRSESSNTNLNEEDYLTSKDAPVVDKLLPSTHPLIKESIKGYQFEDRGNRIHHDLNQAQPLHNQILDGSFGLTDNEKDSELKSLHRNKADKFEKPIVGTRNERVEETKVDSNIFKQVVDNLLAANIHEQPNENSEKNSKNIRKENEPDLRNDVGMKEKHADKESGIPEIAENARTEIEREYKTHRFIKGGRRAPKAVPEDDISDEEAVHRTSKSANVYMEPRSKFSRETDTANIEERNREFKVLSNRDRAKFVKERDIMDEAFMRKIVESGDDRDIARSAVHKEDKSSSNIYRKDRSRSDVTRENRSRSDVHKENRSRSDVHRKNESRSDVHKENRSRSDVHRENRSRSDVHTEERFRSDVNQKDRSRYDVIKEDRSESGAYKEDISKSDVHEEDISRLDAHKDDRFKSDAHKKDRSRFDSYKEDISKSDVHEEDISRFDAHKDDRFKSDAHKKDRSRFDSYKEDRFKSDAYKEDKPRPDVHKDDRSRSDAYKESRFRPDTYKENSSKPDAYGKDLSKPDAYKEDLSRSDTYKEDLSTTLDVYREDQARSTKNKDTKHFGETFEKNFKSEYYQKDSTEPVEEKSMTKTDDKKVVKTHKYDSRVHRSHYPKKSESDVKDSPEISLQVNTFEKVEIISKVHETLETDFDTAPDVTISEKDVTNFYKEADKNVQDARLPSERSEFSVDIVSDKINNVLEASPSETKKKDYFEHKSILNNIDKGISYTSTHGVDSKGFEAFKDNSSRFSNAVIQVEREEIYQVQRSERTVQDVSNVSDDFDDSEKVVTETFGFNTNDKIRSSKKVSGIIVKARRESDRWYPIRSDKSNPDEEITDEKNAVVDYKIIGSPKIVPNFDNTPKRDVERSYVRGGDLSEADLSVEVRNKSDDKSRINVSKMVSEVVPKVAGDTKRSYPARRNMKSMTESDLSDEDSRISASKIISEVVPEITNETRRFYPARKNKNENIHEVDLSHEGRKKYDEYSRTSASKIVSEVVPKISETRRPYPVKRNEQSMPETDLSDEERKKYDKDSRTSAPKIVSEVVPKIASETRRFYPARRNERSGIDLVDEERSRPERGDRTSTSKIVSEVPKSTYQDKRYPVKRNEINMSANLSDEDNKRSDKDNRASASKIVSEVPVKKTLRSVSDADVPKQERRLIDERVDSRFYDPNLTSLKQSNTFIYDDYEIPETAIKVQEKQKYAGFVKRTGRSGRKAHPMRGVSLEDEDSNEMPRDRQENRKTILPKNDIPIKTDQDGAKLDTSLNDPFSAVVDDNPIELAVDSEEDQAPHSPKKSIFNLLSCVGGRSAHAVRMMGKSKKKRSTAYYEEGEKRKIKKISKDKKKEEKKVLYFEKPESDSNEDDDSFGALHDESQEDSSQIPSQPSKLQPPKRPSLSKSDHYQRAPPFQHPKPLSELIDLSEFVDLGESYESFESFEEFSSEEDPNPQPVDDVKKASPEVSNTLNLSDHEEGKFSTFMSFGKSNISPGNARPVRFGYTRSQESDTATGLPVSPKNNFENMPEVEERLSRGKEMSYEVTAAGFLQEVDLTKDRPSSAVMDVNLRPKSSRIRETEETDVITTRSSINKDVGGRMSGTRLSDFISGVPPPNFNETELATSTETPFPPPPDKLDSSSSSML